MKSLTNGCTNIETATHLNRNVYNFMFSNLFMQDHIKWEYCILDAIKQNITEISEY